MKSVFDILQGAALQVDVPAALVETHKHDCLADAIKATMANIGLELIHYKTCTIHPPVDSRRLFRFYIT